MGAVGHTDYARQDLRTLVRAPRGCVYLLCLRLHVQSCSSWSGASAVLRVLAPDLLQRLHEEYAENRWARTCGRQKHHDCISG